VMFEVNEDKFQGGTRGQPTWVSNITILTVQNVFRLHWTA
jgi:hypothetical protein